jgi:hypothetical protein
MSTANSRTNSRTNSLANVLATAPWMQFSVQHYFATFNWDNKAAPLQQFELTTASATPTLDWSVNQFFGALNWEGTGASSAAISAPVAAVEEFLAADDSLLLADFADLFG